MKKRSATLLDSIGVPHEHALVLFSSDELYVLRMALQRAERSMKREDFMYRFNTTPEAAQKLLQKLGDVLKIARRHRPIEH